MKRSAIDRAVERLEAQARESQARTDALREAIVAVKAEAGQRIVKARTSKPVKEGATV